MILTGCRKNEILSLRWKDVDFHVGELHLADAKTGPRTVQLPPWAVTHLSTVYHLWLDVRAKAGLDDVRLHNLRRSFTVRPFGPSSQPRASSQNLGIGSLNSRTRSNGSDEYQLNIRRHNHKKNITVNAIVTTLYQPSKNGVTISSV